LGWRPQLRDNARSPVKSLNLELLQHHFLYIKAISKPSQIF
jgi:hypothetical protein